MSAVNIYIQNGVTLSNGVTVDGSNRSTAINHNSLQLYLDAANSTSFTDGQTVWHDLSPNGNDVTMTNPGAITYIGEGGYFTLSSGGYFNRTSTTNLPRANMPYHFSAWVQWPSGSWPGTGGIVSIGSAFGTPSAVNALRTINSPLGFDNYWWGNDFAQYVSLGDYTQWVNVAAQWDGATRSIWVNGQLKGSQSASGLDVADGLLQIGATNTSGSEPLSGNISIVLVYNRALAPLEIQNNFNATRSRFGV